ncbi:Tetratricopeptide repeat protein [Nesidiocoris tenuis]|uniref:Tetratricopeptide repeat protein n=1 Tax=Nesidiocoris tenuis TaxID=355587 RepID=A0ABN7ACQ6_9HEMI|nr:Tetratricopeptide repeat protein [Nesidiocoris tenuis]
MTPAGIVGPVSVAGFLNLFHRKEEEEESELIMTIKRAVLMIQRDEFKTAEQLLHVALKLAQEQQNDEGVTYIYDLMANLAFAQGEFGKAEKLFVQTMQRVIASGTPQDDIKVVHMSLKLAKICEEKKRFNDAEVGYDFCVKTLEKKVKKDPDDEDLLTLWAMALDWYARFLLDKNRLAEAFNYFMKAYKMCLKVNGEIHEQTVVLLNDLGSVSFLKGDHDGAMEFLTKAVEIGKHLPNMHDFSSVYVNLGNVCLQQKMFEEAKKHCKEGMKNAKRHSNPEGIQEATLCLDEVSKVWKH